MSDTKSGLDLLRIFKIATSGFLSMKFLKPHTILPPSYETYWLSLHGAELSAYSDETQKKMLHRFVIDSNTSVFVSEIEYTQANCSSIICCISQGGKPKCYFKCSDETICENWMIVIIERSKGVLNSKIEKFDLNKDVMDDELDVQSESRATISGAHVREGFLSRYSPRSVFFAWSMTWVDFRNDVLRCWISDDRTIRERTQCAEFLNVDAFSRVGFLPNSTPGECKFFVAAKCDDDIFMSWRFCGSDPVVVAEWVKEIQESIYKSQVRYSAKADTEDRLNYNDIKTERSTIRSAEEVNDFIPSLLTGRLEDLDFSVVSNCPVVYQRDDTLMSLVMQKIRGIDADQDIVRLFYLQRFCHPVVHGFIVESEAAVGTEPVICVSVFENQRFLPFNGFSALNLIIGLDPAKLSDMDGCKFPDRYLKLAQPPDGYEWVPDSKFKVDFAYSDTGEGGWTYASSFPRYAVHRKQRRSLTDINHPKAKTRRRRWIRKAQQINNGSTYC